MSQMSQLEPLDVKFRALLDPIKDLAANWDIDIADSLTDYLEELESLRMSSDGQNTLNFAAAGLLIQGSTAVYSKKVEFLHQLVLQSLSQITNSKSSSSNGNGKNKNMSCSLLDDERLIFGTDPSYLLLDDAVEEGSNINLVDLPDSGLNNTRRRSSVRLRKYEITCVSEYS
jgi:condensin-2 complex subunit H2